jgi:hypothetical protein
MPDDRLIHLAYGHSEKVNRLSSTERDVWLIYKLAADDFGVMRMSATPLQDAALWLERQPAKRILQALMAVRDVGLIGSFEHQGQTYVFDPVWQTWQKITHPRQTKQPAPPLERCCVHTRWLFTHHPKGGKLKSWQAPNPVKTGSEPGENREPTGSSPGKDRKDTGPVFVGNGGVGVGVSGSGEERPARGFGAGAGSFPRDHLYCRPPCVRICLSEKQHGILRERHGGTDADLDAFYAEVRSRLDPTVPIGDTPWKFWDGQFAAKFGAVAVVNPRTAGNAAAAARFVARGRS